MASARNYKPSDLKKLFALSGNNCAMTNCPNKLISKDGNTVIGKICHIEAASVNGPRWNKDMTDDERRGFDNLILMCSDHHDEIDNELNLSRYTTPILQQMKSDYENGNIDSPFEIREEYIDQLNDQLTELLELTNTTHNKVSNIEQIVTSSAEEIIKIQNQMKDFMASFDKGLSEGIDLRYDWVGSEKMQVFESLLKKYNDSIVTKREQFLFTQKVIRNFIDIPHLKEKVNEWNQYHDEPEKLDQLDFISTGVMAYNSLKQIPSEILEDLRLLNWCPIHHAFFDGYLGTFIREIKTIKSLKIDLEKNYKKDKYLFENLKRIIESLRLFLDYDVDNIYTKKEEAKIIETLPEKYLLISTESEITIRNPIQIEEIYARLPLDKQFRVSRLELVQKNGKSNIIGFNARECFYWNPQEDIISNTLYKAKENERIRYVFNKVSEDGRIYTYIQIANKLIQFIDFKEIFEKNLGNSLYLTPFDEGYIGIKSSFGNDRGELIYRVRPDLITEPILTIESLREIVRKNKEINQWYLEQEANEEPYMEGFLDLNNITMQKVIHNNEELFLLKGSTRRTGILILTKINGLNIEPLITLHLKKSTSISVDYISKGTKLELCCALLDLNRNDEICEYIILEDYKLISRQIILKERGKTIGVRDMFYANIGSNNNIYVCEEGHSIILYSLEKKEFKEYHFGDERINYMKYIDSSGQYE